MPVSSLTISARPSRISCSLCAMGVAPWCVDGSVLLRCVLTRVTRRAAGVVSGQDDDLRGVDQAGAEADLQREAAARRPRPRSIRSVASGIEAAEVLPVSAMSRATGTCSGSFSCLIIASMIRMLAWWGMKASRSSAVTPAASSACWATGAISQTAQRKTVWPCIVDRRELARRWSRTSTQRVALGDGVALRAVGAPDGRADAGHVGRADHDRAGAVAEDEGGRAVVGVGEVGELLDADDQDVLGAAAADHVVGQRDAVAEAGAGGRDVERRAAWQPSRSATSAPPPGSGTGG